MKQDSLHRGDIERACVCKERNYNSAEYPAEKDSHVCKGTTPGWERELKIG